MAWHYTDLSLEMQNSIMEILLTNRYKVHPRIKNKIYELDMYFSSRISPLSRDQELVDEEKEYVEKVFQSIYSYSNKVSSFLAFFFCLDYTNFIFFS